MGALHHDAGRVLLGDMIITQDMKQRHRWPQLIRKERQKLHLTQDELGVMFGVKRSAVSMWELGHREAPYDVTWWLYMRRPRERR